MLSEKSTPVVRATLPAVGAAVGEITELFHAKLFEAHPDLLRDLFNRGNQAAGTQRQAPAGSIAAFATHLLTHPDSRPDAMLRRIAHKHASLGVSPARYRVVHQHLFAAIVEVLMLSLLHELQARDHRQPVLVVHGDRSPTDHALRAEQATLAEKLADGRTAFWYERDDEQMPQPADHVGLVDLDAVEVPAGAVAYLCGPLPFMRAVRAQLLDHGVAAGDIHYEVFGPDLWLTNQ